MVHAAARGRASGSTPARWHAVELHRVLSEVDSATELAVCDAMARIAVDQPWPPAAADVCPACVDLTR